jgi:hypothetical protein
MDRFPQAYDRFIKDVDTSDVQTFHQIEMMFGSWAGHKWHGTGKQIRALEIEWRNKLGGWYYRWVRRKTYSLRYFKRISGYMKTHPHATLSEARGHRKK